MKKDVGRLSLRELPQPPYRTVKDISKSDFLARAIKTLTSGR